MQIRLKGFGNKKENIVIKDDYRVCSNSVNWKVTKNKSSLMSDGIEERDDDLLEAFWQLYQNDEMAFAVVQAISLLSLGESFLIEGISNKKELDRLTKSFRRAWSSSMYDVVRDALVFGNSYSFIRKNKAGEFYDLEAIFPLDVTKVPYKSTFKYEYNGKMYSDEQIFELSFFERSDNIYAISLLKPIYDALTRKNNMERGIETAISRHMPRFVITCKPDGITGRYPTFEERKKVGDEFKALSGDNEFVTTDAIAIDVIDTKSTIPQLEDYMMFCLNSCLVGTLIPPEIIGAVTKSGSFATAKSRSNVFLSYVLPFYQNSIANSINNIILKDTEAIIKILRPESLALPYSK